MPDSVAVTPAAFAGVQSVDMEGLSRLPEAELRPILPCLVRMSLCAPLDASAVWLQERKKTLKCLSGVEIVNSLVGLLSIDFHELEQDARKEIQLRAKIGGNPAESQLIASLPQGITLEFERCDAARKLRLLLSEMLFIMYQMKQPRTEFYHKSCELFESEVYLEEVSDVLCIAQAELPGLLPIVDVAEALLHVSNGAWLLCRLVANSPDSFHEVCESLVANGESQDEESVAGQRRQTALLMLCDMCSACSLTVRSLCVSHCKQPSVAIKLTLHYDSSSRCIKQQVSGIVSFVCSLLLDSDSNVRNWFSLYIRSGVKRKDVNSSVNELRCVLLNQLNGILTSAGHISEDNVLKGCAFIRLYSALKCIAQLKFTDEENHALFQLITCKPPPTKAGVRFSSLGLCMLLACPTVISTTEEKLAVVSWIRWLIHEAERFEQMSGVKASFGGMLLLIAIHFHGSQTSQINDLVSSTLGMKSNLKTNALAPMRTIFIQDIFTEQVVSMHAVKVAVTNNLSANVMGYLPVHCIYHLLRSQTFTKHQVRITDWVFQQLCSLTAPLHGIIPALIEVFVSSMVVITSRASGLESVNEPIAETELLKVFQDPFSSTKESSTTTSFSFTTQISLVYYLLLYEDMLLNNMTTIVACHRKVFRYSAQLMARLPVKYVLQQSQKQPLLYACIYQPLLRLVTTNYPHLCLVSDWLNEATATHHLLSSISSSETSDVDADQLSQAFRDVSSNSTHCATLLGRLLTKSTVDLMPYRNVLVSNLSRFLDSGVSRQCLDLVNQVWTKMNRLFSINLQTQTVNALRPRDDGFGGKIDYSDHDIVMDPLIVLRCDSRVFRCPPLMEITLHNLEAFLQASRSYLSKHIQANPTMEKLSLGQSTDDREKLRSALVATQESAAVQILLECCLPQNDSEKAGTGLLSEFREIQGIICSHLHQMFIADPSLAKLVHFQGYQRELLPLTVSGIPSMHICLDFVAELLAQPQLDKQIFAIDMVSYLSLQYALPKSLTVAKLSVSVMATMLGVLPHDTRPDFYIATLPSLVRCCRVFPPLCEDAVALLTRLGRVVHSHLSTFSGANIVDNEDDITASINVENSSKTSSYTKLYRVIFHTYKDIVGSTALLKHQLQ